VERDPHLVSEIGKAARAAFGKVFEGWDSEVDWPIKRTIEAQIAAASLGYKPLYWDPWGESSVALRSELRRVLRTGAVVDATDAGLLVFQPDVITPIVNSDTTFYRSHGESVLSAVRRVSRMGNNGELLGYGARSIDAPGSVPVRIFSEEAELFASFMSDPRLANLHARERLLDIATYIEIDLWYSIGSAEDVGSS
jgi:hypothetical protein